jgi:hypothetical protein
MYLRTDPAARPKSPNRSFRCACRWHRASRPRRTHIASVWLRSNVFLSAVRDLPLRRRQLVCHLCHPDWPYRREHRAGTHSGSRISVLLGPNLTQRMGCGSSSRHRPKKAPATVSQRDCSHPPHWMTASPRASAACAWPFRVVRTAGTIVATTPSAHPAMSASTTQPYQRASR